MRKTLVILVILATGCGSEGQNVSCEAVCNGVCGSTQGCDCGGCDGTQECVGDACSICVPGCAGRECGDDGCGSECGICFEGYVCLEDGTCGFPCTPMCGVHNCGSDGCDGNCGTCEGTTYCKDGLCAEACQPKCKNKECGDDGCGNSCGECPQAAPICKDGKCVDECLPDCTGKVCGSDGCDGSCGECTEGEVCLEDGICKCVGDCDEKDCGDNGCGGSCGSCNQAQSECQDGLCVCLPACAAKICGSDGCSGSCGECPESHQCTEDGECLCVPDCTGKECGGNGCTGLCGECACGENCTLAGQCLFVACSGKECGQDGCGGSCGDCGVGNYCVNGTCPPDQMSCFDDNEVDWDGCTEGDLTEFLVTDTTANAQTAPAVAGQSNGDFVAVWVSEGEDGSGAGVYGRVFPSDGGVPGDVFAANQVTNGAQDAPALATLADDSIVVVWESMGQDGFLDGIFGRIFTLDGTPAGDEFQVNLFTNFSQSYPVVTGLPGGSFVVSWQSESQDGSETGVMARHFAADGTPDVAEFAVNTFLLSSQGGPALVRFTDGSLFAAWHSMQQDGNGWGIYGQHFSTGLEKTGIEFCVNSTTTGHQAWPSVALTGEDSFVVAWEGPGQNGDESDVMGQRFGPFNKLGDEFLLPQVKTGTQTSVALASAAAGFAAVWQSCPSLGSQVPGEDGDDCGVFVRFFKTDGVSKTGSIGANLFTTGTQRGPAVATLPDKRVVMVWESCPPVVSPDSGQDGDGCGVYARRFAASGELIYR